YVVWSMYLNFRVTKTCTPIDKDWRRLNRRREERWDKVERVKVNDNEGLETIEMSEIFSDINTRERTFWLWFIDVASWRGFINLCCLMASIAWGAWLVWTHRWADIGLLYPLFAWSNRVSENVWKLGQIEHQINWSLPAIQSMIKALEIKPAIVDAQEAQPALIRVSFTIEPGEKVACLGPSGAGKSTTMRKLLRFDDPSAGEILVDGIPLRKISQSSWRRKIGYIPQQSQVFDGTIRDNLIYGLSPDERKAVTDEQIWEVMRLLKIDFKGRL